MSASVLFWMIVPLIILIVIFYFMILKPEKKRQSKLNELHNNLNIGDKITTAGGIVGTIIEENEETYLIETGDSKIEVLIDTIIKKNN